MPATAQGPATCKSGGEYKKVQLCAGAPKCVRNEYERTKAQAAKHGCGMCFQQWCFVESDGKVHRSPENVKPPKVKPVAATLAKVTLGTKLPNVKFNRDGVRADEKVLEWIKSRKEPVSPDEIRKKLTDYSHGSIRNALVRLHKAKKIKSPKFGYWVVA